MIKSFQHSTMIYIDHDVNLVITATTKLSIFNIDRLNMKLIKTFIYLSQFRFDIQYRSEKFNVLSNVLSRLFVTKNINFQEVLNVNVDLKYFQSNMNSSENDRTHVYVTTLVKMFQDFRFKIKRRYQMNFK